MDTTALVNGAAGRPTAPVTPDVDRQEVKRLAQQFEAMLLTQMMREMRRSMLDDEESQGLGQDALVDTGDIAFGDSLSKGGGFGFTSQMLDAFERQADAISATVNGGSPAAPAGLKAPVDAAQRISSAFGWGRDPLSGAEKFHAGVDIAVAYGRDVKAAAEGVVAFAGNQNGYGSTVIIDHGAGRQTRYAHLSDSLVRTGDRVTEGQVVGKSGNSGRSTGPHLHFEMLVNGQAVDPLKGAV